MYDLYNSYNNNSLNLFGSNFTDEADKPSFAFIFEEPECEIINPTYNWNAMKEQEFLKPLEESHHSAEQTNDNSKKDTETLSVSAVSGGEEKCYNAMVDEIIKISYSMKRGEDRIEETPKKDDLIRNRRKLRKREISFLQKEFEKNPDWDKDYIKKIAAEVGLTYYKVYKWNWDQKKKTPTTSTTAASGLGKRTRCDDFSHSGSKRVRVE